MWIRLVLGSMTFALLASALVGCMALFGPSPRRIACLNECGSRKDACMLESHTASNVQWCDDDFKVCGSTHDRPGSLRRGLSLIRRIAW
jgi:hypothetical protein